MDVYARRVAEIQEEAMERYGVVPEHVIVLSDEKDPVWWNQVRERGWYLVESEITTDILETHNSWCVFVVTMAIFMGFPWNYSLAYFFYHSCVQVSRIRRCSDSIVRSGLHRHGVIDNVDSCQTASGRLEQGHHEDSTMGTTGC